MRNETEFFNKVYDLLVSIGGADERERNSFFFSHIYADYPCDEYRFCGNLGFGGKYRRKRNTVDCYREDETPDRLQIIAQLNTELSKILPQST